MMFGYGYFLLMAFCIYCLKDTIAQTGNGKTYERTIFPTDDGNSAVNRSCRCVNFNLCKVNTDGNGIFDLRDSIGGCESYLDVCCLHDHILPLVRMKHPTSCGWRNPDGIGFRIVGQDTEANFGEFPWMVAILKEELMNGELMSNYQCGGSLIHPQAVITAAHCVRNKDNTFIVRAGEWDTQTTRELFPHQNRKVQSIRIHPKYYAGGLFNDIALLILESPFELGRHINVACLQEQGTIMPHGQRCWVTGWGTDHFEAEGELQTILKKIDIPLVNRDTCENSLRTTRLGKDFQLHDTFICAGGELGKDTCEGDGGSPLVCAIPGEAKRYQQVGIVSWGIGCGEHNIPGVYTNMGAFVSWVDAEMAMHNLETSQYKYK